jgi:hypothetical protein
MARVRKPLFSDEHYLVVFLSLEELIKIGFEH